MKIDCDKQIIQTEEYFFLFVPCHVLLAVNYLLPLVLHVYVHSSIIHLFMCQWGMCVCVWGGGGGGGGGGKIIPIYQYFVGEYAY